MLGFPCNQFGAQEPGSNSSIKQFAKSAYGVTFPLMAKVDVNGPGGALRHTGFAVAAAGSLSTSGYSTTAVERVARRWV